jgi:8-oxo-dGTP pyrophosphatase MutT (NUDIX family)
MIDSKRRTINAVGVVFYTQHTRRNLYLLRSSKICEWGLPGGKVERGESLREALERECREEIGYWPENAKLFPIECYSSSDGKFSYHTFFCPITDEFLPTLNHEHLAYCWSNDGVLPRPLHSGLYNTLNYPIIRQKIDLIIDSLK